MNGASSTESLKKIGRSLLGSLRRYKLVLAILLFGSVYAFLVFRINSLSSAPPSTSSVQSKTASFQNPHIDQATIQKIQKLKDNSVNVQALFDKARQNPFHE